MYNNHMTEFNDTLSTKKLTMRKLRVYYLIVIAQKFYLFDE